MAFLDGHSLGMQADRRQVSHVTQQGVQQLTDANVRSPVIESRIRHHFFGVMCPAFAEGGDAEVPSDIILRTIRMQVLQKVSRPDFMHGCKQQI